MKNNKKIDAHTVGSIACILLAIAAYKFDIHIIVVIMLVVLGTIIELSFINRN